MSRQVKFLLIQRQFTTKNITLHRSRLRTTLWMRLNLPLITQDTPPPSDLLSADSQDAVYLGVVVSPEREKSNTTSNLYNISLWISRIHCVLGSNWWAGCMVTDTVVTANKHIGHAVNMVQDQRVIQSKPAVMVLCCSSVEFQRHLMDSEHQNNRWDGRLCSPPCESSVTSSLQRQRKTKRQHGRGKKASVFFIVCFLFENNILDLPSRNTVISLLYNSTKVNNQHITFFLLAVKASF